MTAPTNNTSLRMNFNNLIEGYPALKKFCTKVRDGANIRDVIAKEREKLQNTLTYDQAKTIRSFAMKFNQIVIGINSNDDRLSVAKKVSELLPKVQTCKIHSPIVKQLKRFLKALNKNAALNHPQDVALFRLPFLFTGVQSGIEKRIKAGKVLLDYGVKIKADGLLSLRHPWRFVKDFILLKHLGLLNVQDLSSLETHPNPEILLKSLFLEKWPEKIEDEKTEIKLLENFGRNPESDVPKISFLRRLLSTKQGRNHLIEKYPDNLTVFTMIYLTENFKEIIDERDQIKQASLQNRLVLRMPRD